MDLANSDGAPVMPATSSSLALAVGSVPPRRHGRVAMPDVCSPAVSPAVVTLEPARRDGVPDGAGRSPAEVALVSSSGLQFEPRVQAIPPGRPLRFTNEDAETHNVHNVRRASTSTSQHGPRPTACTVIPDKPGVMRLVCDIHSHMRGYVVVGDSPWVRVCTREGRFRLRRRPRRPLRA